MSSERVNPVVCIQAVDIKRHKPDLMNSNGIMFLKTCLLKTIERPTKIKTTGVNVSLILENKSINKKGMSFIELREERNKIATIITMFIGSKKRLFNTVFIGLLGLLIVLFWLLLWNLNATKKRKINTKTLLPKSIIEAFAKDS